MSIEGKALAEGGTPAYVTRFDGVRVPATDYHPVWLDRLAGDVTSGGVDASRSALRSRLGNVITCPVCSRITP